MGNKTIKALRETFGFCNVKFASKSILLSILSILTLSSRLFIRLSVRNTIKLSRSLSLSPTLFGWRVYSCKFGQNCGFVIACAVYESELTRLRYDWPFWRLFVRLSTTHGRKQSVVQLCMAVHFATIYLSACANTLPSASQYRKLIDSSQSQLEPDGCPLKCLDEPTGTSPDCIVVHRSRESVNIHHYIDIFICKCQISSLFEFVFR